MPPQVNGEQPQSTESTSQYPNKVKQASATIAGKATHASATFFADKILIVITQDGRLAQWIQVPLDAPDPEFAGQQLPSSSEDGLLPMTHLSPKTLFGAANTERETMGQLYATQIASAILTKNPEERRSVLVGLGLSNVEASREVFYDTIDLVLQCV